MSKQDLAAKYGTSKSSKQLVNAAIRAELPGGTEALDLYAHCRAMNERFHQPDTEKAYHLAADVVEALAAAIRQRYGLPLRQD